MRKAYAKLNLYLHVVKTRADGYHDLETLVAFADLADTLAVATSDTLSLEVTGPFAGDAGNPEQNLVMSAARLLQEASGKKHTACLTLDKQIPVGAGLGGGSADAAAALVLLNGHWALGLTLDEMKKIARKLGADVAMCLEGVPLIARGIGDRLEPVALPALHAVLVYPNQPLSTAQVYAALTDHRRFPETERRNGRKAKADTADMLPPPSRKEDFQALAARLALTRNDLQRPAIALMPKVAEVLLALETAPGANRIVRMSGSGSSCFALMERSEDAAALARQLTAQYSEWWVRAAAIRC